MALDFTDHFLLRPGPLPPGLAARLDEAFSVGEQTELALGLALFHGFSKMLIALGLEPAQMDTTVLTTPAAPTTPVPPIPAGDQDRHVALLAARPDLAARWSAMQRQLWQLDVVRDVGDLVAARVGQLLAPPVDMPAGREAALPEALEKAVLETAERFVIDVRAIDAVVTAPIAAAYGPDAVVQAVMAMAIYDGIWRVAAVFGDG